MEFAQTIKNSKKILDIFKKWPSFHDAEIKKILLDIQGFMPCFTASISISNPNNINHIDILFKDIEQLTIENLSNQNIIYALDITPCIDEFQKKLFQVNFDPSIGVMISFTCREIEVL